MSAFLSIMLLLAMVGHSSATWCICREGMSDAQLQKTLDYACGAGADCNPIHSSGPCFNPNTVRAHCNYAVNSYFQRNRQAATACDFSGTATVITNDPSTTGGCMYPSSATSTAGTPTTVNGTPRMVTPNGGSPLTGLGGVNNGLGPTGLNTDMSGGVVLQPSKILFFTYLILTLSGLISWSA